MRLLLYVVKPDDTPGPQHYRYHSSMTLRGRQQTPTASFRGRPKPRGLWLNVKKRQRF